MFVDLNNYGILNIYSSLQGGRDKWWNHQCVQFTCIGKCSFLLIENVLFVNLLKFRHRLRGLKSFILQRWRLLWNMIKIICQFALLVCQWDGGKMTRHKKWISVFRIGLVLNMSLVMYIECAFLHKPVQKPVATPSSVFRPVGVRTFDDHSFKYFSSGRRII